VASAQPQVVLQDSFELPGAVDAWTMWDDWAWVSVPGQCEAQNCYRDSAYLRTDDGSKYFDGVLSVRHDKSQPFWCGRYKEDASLANDRDAEIVASIWQFEDAGKVAPFDPGYWEAGPHDQVQSWLAVLDVDKTEVLAIGVHAHVYSPAPLSSWWENLSYYTTTDGWQASTYPRAQGWRNLKIVVGPYTGGDDDVKFYVAPDPQGGTPVYELIGTGRRQPGVDSRGVAVTQIGFGANPSLIGEDYIANNYEIFWYDLAEVTTEDVGSPCANQELRFDSDNDGDVDHNDFAVIQQCYSGPGQPMGMGPCRCMNSDSDADIDEDDVAAFEDCASGPGIPAIISCDDLLVDP
jgi:hypothetical protein